MSDSQFRIVRMRTIYDNVRNNHTLRQTAQILAEYWPDGSKPWSHASWNDWRTKGKKLKWEARTALCRYAGMPDPPHEVTITTTNEVEVIKHTDDPRAVILIGDETQSVTIKQASPESPTTRLNSFDSRVKVLRTISRKRTRKRRNISLYDLGLYQRLRDAKDESGLPWDKFLAQMLDK